MILDISPLASSPVIAGLLIFILVLTFWLFWTKGRRAWPRAVMLMLFWLALFDPSLVHEEREPLKDVVALVVDESASNMLGDRREQTQAALSSLTSQLKAFPSIDLRVIPAGHDPLNEGTRLFDALTRGLADVAPERLAGVVMITDGVIHDSPVSGKLDFQAPVHALITGHAQEVDRRLVVRDAPRFGLVGKEQTLRVRVEDTTPSLEPITLTLRLNGQATINQTVMVNEDISLLFQLDHAGPSVLEVEVSPRQNELTLINNRAVISVEGVREKLNVLLISGEPHAGERTWRNLLKSDPNVDLIHFTILRPPEKQDGSPIHELSLIAFPTRELFQVKIQEFDLIILDRYANQSILPLPYYENIAQYVRKGGALLIASGPEFAGPNSLTGTPLKPIIPALSDGQIVDLPFRPQPTSTGLQHPVIRDLPGLTDTLASPNWGRWMHLLGSTDVKGQVVLSGEHQEPLLILNHEEKGRVGLLLSDHVWLWARGFEGGGPHVELLRRLSHWLMKEPELEEERLWATVQGQALRLHRQTMSPTTEEARIVMPSGREVKIPFISEQPGLFSGNFTTDETGLHRITQGSLSAFAGVGALNSLEYLNVSSDPQALVPLLDMSGGSSRRIEDLSSTVRLPRLVMTDGSRFSGPDWIGLKRTHSSRITRIGLYSLMMGIPGWLILLIPLVGVWLVEGRGLLTRFRTSPTVMKT